MNIRYWVFWPYYRLRRWLWVRKWTKAGMPASWLTVKIDEGTEVKTYKGLERGSYSWWKDLTADNAAVTEKELTVESLQQIYSNIRKKSEEMPDELIVLTPAGWRLFRRTDGKVEEVTE
ncbi:MAG: hypothetical protein V3W37_03085 [Candidatus Binatia bacterium]